MALWTNLLAPERAIDWQTYAGVSGGITHRTTIYNPNANGNTTNCDPALGTTPTTALINAAIAACPDDQVVQLGAGTITGLGRLSFTSVNYSNVTLRGRGANNTKLVFSSTGGSNGLDSCIMYISNSTSNWPGGPQNVGNITGYTWGSTRLNISIVSGSLSNIQVGTQLILDQTNDTVDAPGMLAVKGGNWTQDSTDQARAGRANIQVVHVTNVVSSGVYDISPPIYMPNFRAGNSPQAWWSSTLPITRVGVEDLTLDVSGVAPSGTSSMIFLSNASHCWVKGCRFVNSRSTVTQRFNKHIRCYTASRCTFQSNYLYGSRGQSDSYGIDSANASSDNLTVNNIAQNIASGFIHETATGCVVAYNYAYDTWYDGGGGASNWNQDSNTHHANDAFLLFEGNEGSGCLLDNEVGSGNMITLYRNLYTGRDTSAKTASTTVVESYAWGRYFNFIGNVLGIGGYHTTYDFAPTSASDAGSSTTANRACFVLGWGGYQGTRGGGNDMRAPATLMRWGNYTVTRPSGAGAGIREEASENGSGAEVYPALASPLSYTAGWPASFVFASQPSWWKSGIPWPPIGPDKSGGNATHLGETWGGTAYKIPARACFEQMADDPAYAAGTVKVFDASFYGTATTPPTGTPVLSVR